MMEEKINSDGREAAERNTVKMHELIETANDVGFHHLVSRRLRLEDSETVWTVEGAGIEVEGAKRRTGVPPDAKPVRYRVQYPDGGWSFVGRAVWRGTKLLEPKAVHNVIETYNDDDGRFGDDDDAVAAAVNEWLKCL